MIPFPFHVCRLCVIAGNISPIDVITHVPILCEESDIPYIYVPSKEVILVTCYTFSFPCFLGHIMSCPHMLHVSLLL